MVSETEDKKGNDNSMKAMLSFADLGVLITKKFNRDKPRTVGYVIAYIESAGLIDKDGRFRVGDEVRSKTTDPFHAHWGFNCIRIFTCGKARRSTTHASFWPYLGVEERLKN